MSSSRLLAVLCLVFALVAVCASEISISPTSSAILASFGVCEATFYVISTDASGASVAESDLFTVDSIDAVTSGEYTNYTINLSGDNRVGRDDVTVTVGAESVTASLTCAGFVISSEGKAVSGDGSPGVRVGTQGTYKYDVKSSGEDGQPDDLSNVIIRASAKSGSYRDEVDLDQTSFTNDGFILTIKGASASGLVLSFENPDLSIGGEVYENVLNVEQDTSSSGCVAIGGTYSVSNGQVSIGMKNTLDKSSISISAGGQSGSWDKESSTMSTPEQTIVFDFNGAGVATITCDGVEATTEGGDVIIESSGGDTVLAVDNVQDSPDGTSDQLVVNLRIIDSSPATFSLKDALAMVSEFCKVIAGSNCAFTRVVEGSAILTVEGAVEDPEAGEAKFRESIKSCEFQKNVNYACDKIVLVDATVKAVGGASGAVAGAAGLATWTIVLIAALGAFALIVLIMLGLLAVYRRSAEQSESDYSSSGPLGVPDPSDLLYEQSIVRDIYGRGDFPDGGPSRAVAEQREREAALREEFPRPPSSSGLSRGSATDDASSTYSV